MIVIYDDGVHQDEGFNHELCPILGIPKFTRTDWAPGGRVNCVLISGDSQPWQFLTNWRVVCAVKP